MKQKIGFIGLGNLGTPIALNLINSGHTYMFITALLPKPKPLQARGAIVCDSVAELAKQCNIVFTIVSDDAALKNICEGRKWLIKSSGKDSIHVSMSTILPQTAEELAFASRSNMTNIILHHLFSEGRTQRNNKTKLLL